jgi:putative PIN family toxin of toxin-antitoxin system
VLLASPPIVDEYVRVLAYPKFKLGPGEIEELLREEVLPFVTTVRPRRRLRIVRRDPDDDKFVDCALSGRARYVVTGDKALLDVGRFRRVSMIRVGDLLRVLGETGGGGPVAGPEVR